MSALTLKLDGDLKLRKQLAVLRLPPGKRKQLGRKLGREVIRQSKKRTSEQRDVHGNSFENRRRGRGKMLKRMMRPTKVYAGPDKTKVTWPNPLTGRIAFAHQHGIGETMTAEKARRKNGTPDYDAPCTPEQAKALLAEGYRQPTGGRYKSGQRKGQTRTKRVSKRWIQDNITLGQAGLLLKILRSDDAKSSWEIDLPQRSFFGVSKAQYRQMAIGLIDDVLADVKAARR